MAKPVVSTSIGAEGLTYQHGHDILIADDPAAFAAAVEALFREPARRRELGLAARQRTEAEYSVEALARAMRLALTTLFEGAPLAGSQAPQPTRRGSEVVTAASSRLSLLPLRTVVRQSLHAILRAGR